MIKYDGPLEIATGKNRKETHWKNGSTLWSDLLDKLRETHRTHETMSEYIRSDKARQAEIKDIGGFVAGYVNKGRRKAGNITSRSALTLDLDFAQPGFWDVFTALFSCAACVYSTHKHTPDAPRLRLIVPLDRTVAPDEYVAISRRVAGDLGINDFDDTTFEPSRLMYWPSTSKDGEYEFHQQDGKWLSADEILSTYKDWTDSSAWPVSDRVKEAIQRGADKQGDPLEKTGTIGAFCREYGIHEAIGKFLSDRYEPVPNSDDRYTYMHGSTSAGLVVYEDKYAYSHHGTDPISGKLVNAFDLVRLHLHGDKDERVKEGTPPSKHPSFVAMEEFVLADKAVRHRIATERLEEAKTKFSSALWSDEDEAATQDVSQEEYDDSWLGELDQTKKGETNATIDNALIILRNDPVLKGLFALNKFDLREIATRNMPWRKIDPMTRSIKDADDVGLRHYIETKYNLKSKQCIQDAMVLVTEENGFHPIKDYFATLEWDGMPRIDTLLIDYLGAEDTRYARTVTRKFCVAAVSRIMSPGCKFDNVLLLVGAQGTGKSTFFQKLGGKWHSDSFGNIQGKEAFESLQGTWIMELGELAGLRKAESEAIKLFLAKREDRYRVAYGRRTDTFPRQCVFGGTTNEDEPLEDPTGGRRWWPVKIGIHEPECSVWDDLTSDVVDQVWAEALYLYNEGETLYLDKESSIEATEVQRDFTVTDERVKMVELYLSKKLPKDWSGMDEWERRNFLNDKESEGTIERTKVTPMEIWTECFGKNPGELEGYKTKELKRLLSQVRGWEHKVIKIGNKPTRGWVKKGRRID